MSDLGIAIAVVWWIGGIAFAATVFLPALRAGETGMPAPAFHAIECRFAPQACIAVILTGLSGGYWLWRCLQRMHTLLLVIGLIIIAGAVAGSHGFRT
ncbi:MAG TPA: hypothetical protein VFX47_06695 [Gammaproteobacteria bacterium]|nr:hypothetical protein [Gammaproteobacteria bacterium]